MNIGIVILACSRPKYLRATLGSVLEADNTKPIIIQIDRTNLDMHKRNIDIISGLNIARINVAQRSGLPRMLMMEGIEQLFRDYNCDYALAMCDDCIIRQDTFEWFENRVPKNAFSYSLLAWDPDLYTKEFAYYPTIIMRGMIIGKESFNFLYNLVKSNIFWGKEFHGTGKRFYHFPPADVAYSIDGPIAVIGEHYGLITLASCKPHLAHFGIRIARAGQTISEDLLEMEKRMFSGNPESWHRNIANIIKAGQFDEKWDIRLFPKGFELNDK